MSLGAQKGPTQVPKPMLKRWLVFTMMLLVNGIICVLVFFVISQTHPYPQERTVMLASTLPAYAIAWIVAAIAVSLPAWRIMVDLISSVKCITNSTQTLPLTSASAYGQFRTIEDADKAEHSATRFLYSGLYASGYTHSGLIRPLHRISLTGLVMLGVQMLLAMLLTFFFSNISRSNYTFELFSLLLSIIIYCIIYYIVTIIVLPRTIVGANQLINDINNRYLLVISDSLGKLSGGIQIAINGFVKSAVSIGVKLVVIGPVHNEASQLRQLSRTCGFGLIMLPAQPIRLARKLAEKISSPFLMTKYIKTSSGPLLINTLGPIGIYSLFLGHKYHLRTVFIYHSYLPGIVKLLPFVGHTRLVASLAKELTRFAGRMADIVIAPSPFIARELEAVGINRLKIRVVPTGLDHDFIQPPDHSQIERIANSYDHPLLLYVGRISREKNLNMLIQAFKIIHDRHPSANMLIIGDGSHKQELEKQVSTLNLHQAVHFMGYLDRDKIQPYYWSADIFCTASDMETQGLSLQEAMACNRPCVALAQAGVTSSIKDGTDGLLVSGAVDDPDTIQAFADAIDQLISNPEYANMIGKAARTRALQWTLQESTSEILQLLGFNNQVIS